MQFHIPDMACDGCLRGVTKAVHNVDPKAGIEADLPARRVMVTSERPATDFLPALQAAGFPATVS